MHFLESSGRRLEIRQIAGSAPSAPIVFRHEGLGCIGQWTQRDQLDKTTEAVTDLLQAAA